MWPIQLAFLLFLFVGYSPPPWLFVTLLRLLYDRSNWSSSFYSTTFQNFPGVSDLPSVYCLNCICVSVSLTWCLGTCLSWLFDIILTVMSVQWQYDVLYFTLCEVKPWRRMSCASALSWLITPTVMSVALICNHQLHARHLCSASGVGLQFMMFTSIRFLAVALSSSEWS
jgi:hypothetical protein